MIRIKHLISLISTLIQFVPQIGITLLIQIQYPVNSHRMVAFFILAELDLLPLLTGWFVTPS